MLWLTRSLTALALPPVLLLALMLAALVLLRMGRRRAAAGALALACALFYLLSVAPVRDFLVAPLERQYPVPPPAELACDAIIVLGGGTTSRAVPGGPPPALAHASTERVLAAYQLWRRLRVPILLCGGSAWSGEAAEAPAMAEVLNSLGVPDSALTLEWWSQTTHGNAVHSRAVAEVFAWQRPCLVTSAWHMPRAARAFRQQGLNIVPYPAGVADRSAGSGWLGLVPSLGALQESTNALREYLALVWYRVRHGV